MRLRTNLCLIAAILWLSTGRIALSADALWPQFRGANAAGIANETDVPIEFGPQKNVLWKTPLPEGHSSPIVWNDRIFLTAFDEARLDVICIARGTGEILWREIAGERRGLQKGHPTNSRASPTPATDGKRVYVYFGPLGLFAYDFEGNEKWRVQVPKVKQPWGVGTSPVLADDKVLLNIDYDIDSFLIAVDAETGEEVWRTERPEFRRGFSTPLVLHERNQVVVAGSLRLASYDLKTGREVWSVKGLPYQVSPSPIVADGMVYMAAWDAAAFVDTFDSYLKYDTNKDGKIAFKEYKFAWDHPKFDRNKDGFVTREEFDGFVKFSGDSRPMLLAIDPSGKGDVTKTHVKWESTKSLPHISTVLAYRGLIYTIRGGGIATCYDATTGTIHYRARIPAPGPHYASPIANDGKIYFASQGGDVAVVKAGPNMEVLATNKMGESIFATPAIVDSKIYLRTDKHLYAIAEGAHYTDPLLADLNRHRESLAGRFEHDFANDELGRNSIFAHGIRDAFEQTKDGVRVVAPGADRWTSAVMDVHRALRGDFDLTAHVETIKLQQPPTRGLSGVYFEVRIGKELPTSYTIASNITAQGVRRVHTTLGETKADGKRNYQGLGHLDIDAVDRLRIIRRGDVIYLLGAVKGSDHFRLVERKSVRTDDVPLRAVKMYVHAHGEGTEAVALWKRLDIRADQILKAEQE